MFTDGQNQDAKKPQTQTEAPRKYMFDLSFDNGAAAARRVERKPVLMKPEQIDAMKKESHDAGFVAGNKAGKDQQIAQLQALMATVDKNIVALLQSLGDVAKNQEAQTRQLVMAVAKKVLPEFVARQGLGEIESVMTEAIRDMAREPRLVIRVEEAQLDAVNERAQAIAQQRAYQGKIIVLADPNVAAGDCRIEWADGGIERNTKELWDAVEQTVNPQS